MRVFDPLKNSHFCNICILLLENELSISDIVEQRGISHPAILKILQQMVEVGILPEPHKEKKQYNRTLYILDRKIFLDFLHKSLNITSFQSKKKKELFNIFIISKLKAWRPTIEKIYSDYTLLNVIEMSIFEYNLLLMYYNKPIDEKLLDLIDNFTIEKYNNKRPLISDYIESSKRIHRDHKNIDILKII